jgi:hypothetical protein
MAAILHLGSALLYRVWTTLLDALLHTCFCDPLADYASQLCGKLTQHIRRLTLNRFLPCVFLLQLAF